MQGNRSRVTANGGSCIFSDSEGIIGEVQMVYRKATEQDLAQIIDMKNRVKEQIIREGLPI